MTTTFLHGKDLLSTEDWQLEDLTKIIQLAARMKRARFSNEWRELLKNKSFLMLFCNQSLRTHLSFDIAATELGGHSIYRTQNMGWIKTSSNANVSGESIQDAVRVISRYVHGIGIRMTLDAITNYGEGHAVLHEYARYADVPVVNMADDMFHPCQGLADIMGWAEYYGGGYSKPDLQNLSGKKLLLTWARSGLARPWSAVQSHLLLAARYGMHITLAHPEGYDLDPDVCSQAEKFCRENKKNFSIVHDPDIGYTDAHVVYTRNWITKDAYYGGQFNHSNEIEKALLHTNWKVTVPRMQRTANALFANPMPVDRDIEAESAVIDSKQSILYDVAENRLHIQKAILALIMGDAP